MGNERNRSLVQSGTTLTAADRRAGLLAMIAQEPVWAMEQNATRAMLADPEAFFLASNPQGAAAVKCDCTCDPCDNGDCDECDNKDCNDPNCTDCPTQNASAKGAQSAISQAPRSRAGAVAVLSLYGPVFYRGGWWSSSSILSFQAKFRQALADDSISSIVIDVDSPGGTIGGVQELAAEIMAARATKTIVAVCNDMMCSAAYWIAAAATEVVCVPSGEVGSIGAWCAHFDLSEMYKSVGVAVTLIQFGKYKTEGNPFEPLTEDARAYIQTRIDETGNQFIKDVAKFRGKSAADVKSSFGEGRVMGAKAALDAGMIDRIATLEATLGRLGVPAANRSNLKATRDREIEILSKQQD